MADTRRWCWRLDGGEWRGNWDTREQCIGDARDRAAEQAEGWLPRIEIGRIVTPRAFLAGKEATIAGDILELIASPWLDDFGDLAADAKLEPDRREELGALILDFVAQWGGFVGWTVADVEEIPPG